MIVIVAVKSKMCDDNHILCDDLRTGTRVCVSCGKVFDVLLFDSDVTNATSSVCDPNARQLLPLTPFNNDVIVREFLLDGLALLHMNNGFFVDRVINALHQIAGAYEDNDEYIGKHYVKLCVRHERDLGRLAYVVLDTMHAEHCPKSPAQVAHALNTTTAFMRMAEKELSQQPAYSQFNAYVPRLTAELYLPRWISIAVEKAVQHVTNHVVIPEHIIGAILWAMGDLLRASTVFVDVSHMLTVDKIVTVVGSTEKRLLELRSSLPQAVTKTLKRVIRRDVATKELLNRKHMLLLYGTKRTI